PNDGQFCRAAGGAFAARPPGRLHWRRERRQHRSGFSLIHAPSVGEMRQENLRIAPCWQSVSRELVVRSGPPRPKESMHAAASVDGESNSTSRRHAMDGRILLARLAILSEAAERHTAA